MKYLSCCKYRTAFVVILSKQRVFILPQLPAKPRRNIFCTRRTRPRPRVCSQSACTWSSWTDNLFVLVSPGVPRVNTACVGHVPRTATSGTGHKAAIGNKDLNEMSVGSSGETPTNLYRKKQVRLPETCSLHWCQVVYLFVRSLLTDNKFILSCISASI